MSFFSKLESAAHTFAAWAEERLEKLYGEAPKIEQIAGSILTYAGPALQTVVTVEAGAPAGAIVGKVIKQAQSDLVAASGLIYDFGATPTTASIVAGVQSNLDGLLSAAHVTNANSVSTVKKVSAELGALVSALAPANAAQPAS